MTKTLVTCILSAVLVMAACGKPEQKVPTQKKLQAKTKPVVTEKKKAPLQASLIMGKWQLVSEEAADPKGGFFRQERRLLALKAGGAYHVENYLSSWKGTWKLQGRTLVLRKVRKGSVSSGNVLKIPGAPPAKPTQKKPDQSLRIQVDKVSKDTLVLLEQLPTAYLRKGPPRTVRNTYRRVSEAELGPMLGKELRRSVPVPGTYGASYNYSRRKFRTMEIVTDRRIQGRAKLTLNADGTVEGCLAVKSYRHFSRSKYASRDRKHHSTKSDDRWLAGIRGTWERKADKARVRVTKYWTQSCRTTQGQGQTRGTLELECTALAPNETLPVATLACRMVTAPHLLKEMALNPADTERAGPYTLQEDRRIRTDQGRPWLLLGALPGLEITSRDTKRNAAPVIRFAAKKVQIMESSFRPRRKPKERRAR